MKTVKNIFHKITAFDNLILAAKKSQKGKRFNNNVTAFHFNLEEEILQLQKELLSKRYKPGAYRTFYIYDPKERMISAAPYRDRVIHHALCNIIEPIFEKTFIYDSYANRKGKGTHKAIERYQKYAKKYPFVLKCDIKKFFPSLDQAILKQAIRWKIRCKDTLWLIDKIIDNSNLQETVLQWFPEDDLFTPLERKKGLPIGNLTSQFWANVYMNQFDHFVKETLKVPGYIRYVDDFVLFGISKQQLWEWKKEITNFLAKMRLRMHPNKTQILRVKSGVPFLGYQLFPQYRYVRKEKIKRYKRYLKKTLKEKADGKISPQDLENRLNAWLGHIRFGQSKRLEYNIFWYLRIHGVNLHIHPRSSWRVLEQQQ